MAGLSIRHLTDLSELTNFICEITYLAVSEECQHIGIGSTIVKAIAEKARSQSIAGCQFLTVNALNISGYSAVAFYSNLGFSHYGNICQTSDVVPMFYTLFPIEDKQ